MATTTKATNRARKNPTCIASGCKRESKGPRFHYLCEAHRDAKAKQVAEWKSKTKIDRKNRSKVARKAA